MSMNRKIFKTIEVNDIFHELSEENKRLLNELLFANKCLNVLNKIKDYFESNFDKMNTFLDSNDFNDFNKLREEVEELFRQKSLPMENRGSDEDNYLFSGKVIKSNDSNDVKPKPKTSPKRRFLCEVNGCEYKTLNKRNLMNHMNGHKDGIKPFKCSSCGKRFFEEQSLKCHIRVVHKFRDKYLESRADRHIGKYVCDSVGCDYETRIKKLFVNHTNHHKGIKPFNCEFISCGKSFISEEGLKSHIELVHKNVRKFKCETIGCDYETANRSRFVNHINSIHKGIRPFECSECSSRFGCESYLRDHIRVVHESDPNAFKCDFEGCLKSFRDSKYLRHHYRTVHLKIKKVKERLFECEYPECQYRADCEAILKIHRVSHSDDRPYRCQYEGCGKSFKIKGSLKVHTEECHLGKIFECQAIGCGMTFSNRTTWKNHFKSQHSNHVLSCDWPGCDYTAKLERNLRKHKLVHKTESDFLCDWPDCGKAFKSRAYLVQHIRIHNNDKRFACSWPGCQYRCSHSGNIHKHRRIHEKKFC